MAFPEPSHGLVIRYSYLWRREHDGGQEEGTKDRPCAVILVATDAGDNQVVTVLPITRTPPGGDLAVEIPHLTKQRLGLDTERSWVVLTEANRFIWPGPDLRMKSPRAGPESVVYGLLPRALFKASSAMPSRPTWPESFCGRNKLLPKASPDINWLVRFFP